MLAAVKSKPGPGIELIEWPKPQLVPGQVLIRVDGCGICGSDLHWYEWDPVYAPWLKLPVVLGHEVAGTVVEVGPGVEGFQHGDRVACETGAGCGQCYDCRQGRFNQCDNRLRVGQHVDGGLAEYMAIQSISLYKVPSHVSMAEAAALEPLGVALHGLERCQLKPGDTVAIVGPGPIGLMAAALAKAYGASRVIVGGLDVDRERLEFAARLGATALNTSRGDWGVLVMDLTDGRGVDVVIDAAGGPGSFKASIEVAKKGGQVVVIGFGAPDKFDSEMVVAKELTIFGAFRRQPSTWHRAINLVASGTIDLKPFITHTFPLDEIEDAFQLLRERKGIKAIIIPSGRL